MKNRRKPKMILFDYGLTLLHEPDFDPLRGDRVVSQYIIKNPNKVTPEEIGAYTRNIFLSANTARAAGFETHEYALLRLVSDSLGLGYSISLEEREQIFWENASTALPMPYIEMLLETLHASGIRTAVVSNISFSEKALKRKIDVALPDNHFEFVLTSSEYGIRKPNPLIFRAALQRANVASEEAWFCGDNFQADILGASGVGIFPVWYRGGSLIKDTEEDPPAAPELLCISDWQELIEILGAD